MDRISKEYAAALFSLAREKGAEAAYGSALETVQKAFEENPEYQALLNTPAVPAQERGRLAAEAFGKAVPGDVLSMIAILSSKGRVMEFGAITAEYMKLMSEMRRLLAATVRSAVPLGAEEKNRLKKKLESMTGRSVAVTYIEDPSLLGGVIVEIDGRVYDGSLRRRLRQVNEVTGG